MLPPDCGFGCVLTLQCHLHFTIAFCTLGSCRNALLDRIWSKYDLNQDGTIDATVRFLLVLHRRFLQLTTLELFLHSWVSLTFSDSMLCRKSHRCIAKCSSMRSSTRMPLGELTLCCVNVLTFRCCLLCAVTIEWRSVFRSAFPRRLRASRCNSTATVGLEFRFCCLISTVFVESDEKTELSSFC